MTRSAPPTPFAIVSAAVEPVLVEKAELLPVCRAVERAALAEPPPAVAATLQDERFLTPRTRAVYAALGAQGVPARLFARGLQSWLAPGVTGVPLDDDDPLVDEWTVVVPSARAPVVLSATDVRQPCDAELERCFRYAVSHDPEVVRACAEALGLGASLGGAGR